MAQKFFLWTVAEKHWQYILSPNLLALEVSCCLVPWYSFREGKSAVFHCSSILIWDQFFKNRLCSHLSKIFPSWVDPFWKSFLIQRSKHSYLLTNEQPPFCISCNEPFTVKHFLITCTEFNYIRNRYFTAKTVKELFTDTSSDKIINFLKETNLFNKL